MTKRAIKSVTVEFVGGGESTWHGVGTLQVVRTPLEAQGAPVLKDSDQSYINAVLSFDRLAWAEQQVEIRAGEGGALAVAAPDAEGGER